MSSAFLCLPDKDILKTVLIVGGVDRLGVRKEVVSGDEESSNPGRVGIIASLSHRIDVVVLANFTELIRARNLHWFRAHSDSAMFETRSFASSQDSSYPSLLGDTAIRGSFRRHFRVKSIVRNISPLIPPPHATDLIPNDLTLKRKLWR